MSEEKTVDSKDEQLEKLKEEISNGKFSALMNEIEQEIKTISQDLGNENTVEGRMRRIILGMLQAELHDLKDIKLDKIDEKNLKKINKKLSNIYTISGWVAEKNSLHIIFLGPVVNCACTRIFSHTNHCDNFKLGTDITVIFLNLYYLFVTENNWGAISDLNFIKDKMQDCLRIYLPKIKRKRDKEFEIFQENNNSNYELLVIKFENLMRIFDRKSAIKEGLWQLRIRMIPFNHELKKGIKSSGNSAAGEKQSIPQPSSSSSPTTTTTTATATTTNSTTTSVTVSDDLGFFSKENTIGSFLKYLLNRIPKEIKEKINEEDFIEKYAKKSAVNGMRVFIFHYLETFCDNLIYAKNDDEFYSALSNIKTICDWVCNDEYMKKGNGRVKMSSSIFNPICDLISHKISAWFPKENKKDSQSDPKIIETLESKKRVLQSAGSVSSVPDSAVPTSAASKTGIAHSMDVVGMFHHSVFNDFSNDLAEYSLSSIDFLKLKIGEIQKEIEKKSGGKEEKHRETYANTFVISYMRVFILKKLHTLYENVKSFSDSGEKVKLQAELEKIISVCKWVQQDQDMQKGNPTRGKKEHTFNDLCQQIYEEFSSCLKNEDENEQSILAETIRKLDLEKKWFLLDKELDGILEAINQWPNKMDIAVTLTPVYQQIRNYFDAEQYDTARSFVNSFIKKCSECVQGNSAFVQKLRTFEGNLKEYSRDFRKASVSTPGSSSAAPAPEAPRLRV